MQYRRMIAFDRASGLCEPLASEIVSQGRRTKCGPVVFHSNGGWSRPGEGAGGGHPSRPARGHGGALEAPPSGSGAPPQKPTLFAL